MCSNNSCDGELKIDLKTENLVGAHCRKCNEKLAKIVLQRKFPYCTECFLLYFYHKYSSGLGKLKLLRNHDKILVAFSGSPYTVCLLDLIFRSLVEDRKKKVKFDVEVLFIDEGYSDSKEERLCLYKSINNIVRNYGYTVHYTVLSTIDNELVLLSNLSDISALDVVDKLFLSEVKSDSIQQDLILKLRNDVLFKAAKKLMCNKIFIADTSDHISSTILSNLALGRGKDLASITGMVDKRKDIMIIRPLRECSKKEAVFYNIFNKLSYSNVIRDFEKSKFSSIQKLSEIFIAELQCSFPSTVSTVVSTGNKLSLNYSDTDFQCMLCHSSLDSATDQLSALDALKISDFVSNNGLETLKNIDITSLENSKCEEPINDESLSKFLCHSCKEIFKETKNLKNDWLKRKIFELNMASMHSDIKDFIL